MTWFYKDGEQEKGPFTKKELQDLINSKTINARTMIRKEDETDWRPLKELAKPKAKPSAEKAAEPAPQQKPVKKAPEKAPAATEAAEATVAEEAEPPATKICSQCGRSFPEDQVVTYDDKIICSNCKPAFVQKLKEGAAMGGALRYAGFWVRAGAKIIDTLILIVVQWIVLIPLNMFVFNSMMQGMEMQNPEEMFNNPEFFMYLGIQWLVQIIIPIVYITFFLGKFAATPGKMACGLKVVAPDGGKISYLRAFGRVFAEWLSGIILCIGYIMAAFDSEKRTLHDRICSTRVIHK